MFAAVEIRTMYDMIHRQFHNFFFKSTMKKKVHCSVCLYDIREVFEYVQLNVRIEAIMNRLLHMSKKKKNYYRLG